MSARLACVVAAMCLAAVPAVAQKNEPTYLITKDKTEKDGRVEDRIHVFRRADAFGNSTLYVTVQFTIARPDGTPVADVLPDEILVKENDQIVKDLEIHTPVSLEPLTTMLAIDISGSMAEHHKMDESKNAAKLFLDKLDPKAECGLILFDHQLRLEELPSSDRQRLSKYIASAKPRGGTAYLDATTQALEMIKRAKGRRAILLLTDGVDINSEKSTMEEVIQRARSTQVPIYTIGVGEPGKNIPVTTAMVLDCSGSMNEPADDSDEIPKIVALRQAGERFIDIMRPGAQTTVIPFSTTVKAAEPFTADKTALKKRLRGLKARGDTALFDAVYDGVRTLALGGQEGKRAVVVLTDGKDNNSHHLVDEVIDEARRTEVHLHMLGLGREGELDERVMQRMGQETGGSYHHARNQQTLYEIFEKLSIDLHDDGIDEAALRRLAEETGGKYYPAHDISRLQLIYQGLAQELQTSYTVTFPSLRQEYDGTSRDISISVWRKGVQVSDDLRGGYNVHGVVVPEMDPLVYVCFLGLLGGLLMLPGAWRRLSKPAPTS